MMTRLTSLTFAIFAMASLTFFASCTKDDEATQPAQEEVMLSDEEVVEVMEATLSQSKGGIAKEMETTSETFESMNLQEFCGGSFTDTLNYEYAGVNVQAFSEIGWNIAVTCNALNLPQSLFLSLESALSLSTPRISTDGAGAFTGDITGLELLSPAIIWNGNYTRSGAYTFNFNQTNSGASDIDLTLTDVAINKQSLMISSGSGVFTVEITNNGNTATYEGAITFHGDQTATIVINGMEFIIDLS